MHDSAIRFLLDGQLHEVSGIDPNTTVLNYLRELLNRRGTKEGCAEGDCGACTVVVAERHQGRIRFGAINSCIQFLPSLHGKALFTVESLRGEDGSLHPVQTAMVAKHGSQCGFCTPGFVMSMFAMYRSEARPDRPRVQDVLAGNLCRCTGYRPIIDAAIAMYDADGKDADWLRRPFAAGKEISRGEQALLEQLKAIEPQTTLAVSGPGPDGSEHRYYAPTTVAELASRLQRYPDARILAGGTDVGLWVTKDHQDIDTTIYVGNVAELKTIERSETWLGIGAGASLTELETVLTDLYPDLGELLRRFASPPIRNAATLGGNIANGSPIGDSMPALIALDARLVLRKGDAHRVLPLDEFFLGYRETALAPGEFIERIRLPLDRGLDFRAHKISKRFDQDISAVLGAFSLRRVDERVQDIRICFGGMAATPKRATQCEDYLKGKAWTEKSIEVAVAELEKDYAPIDDMRASAEYRKTVAANLLRKFFLETSGTGERTRIIAREANA